MSIRAPNLRLELFELDDAPRLLALRSAHALGIDPSTIESIVVRRRSLDARGRRAPSFAVTVDVDVRGDGPDKASFDPRSRHGVWSAGRSRKVHPPPVIVGAGPAGIFAALALLESGVAPILLERGRPVETRKLDVARLYRDGTLNPNSNVSFGEGGAGTFTDGKLSTGNRSAEAKEVLSLLVELGHADSDILVYNRPHLGSERLPRIVAHLRRALLQAGCDVRFESCVADLEIDDGHVTGVTLTTGETIETRAVVLAPGNAARDIFRKLSSVKGLMVPKPIAVGFRIEHPQALIDSIQYGKWAGHPELPPAEYSLKTRSRGRGAWTFCMCPGGVVVPTPTLDGELSVNGMSSSRRAGRFANSAVVVEVRESDFGSFGFGDGLLAPLAFQEHLERAAFEAGGGGFAAPAQTATDYLRGRTSSPSRRSSYPRGLHEADLRAVFPREIALALGAAIESFGRQMPGFLTEEALLIGAETRTSSPFSFPRNTDGCSSILGGLYPCGEGSGHGGGIVSAAADGLRIGRLLAPRVK